jgi:LPXTG-motif cell wall-anchored protein
MPLVLGVGLVAILAAAGLLYFRRRAAREVE